MALHRRAILGALPLLAAPAVPRAQPAWLWPMALPARHGRG